MRFLLLHALFLFLCGVYFAYLNHLQDSAKVQTREKSIARGIHIKVFGKEGQEWDVMGRELVSLGRELNLLGVSLKSSNGYTVSADSVTLYRDKGLSILRGNVTIRGERLEVNTEEATVDFNKNLIWGNEPVLVRTRNTLIEGKGFRAYLRPFRVIISDVRTKHEV